MKFTFLSDNKTENSLCTAEWGLSLLIESMGHKILFDVGSSPIFAQNAKKLKVDLEDVEAVVVSHGHYDHTDGMETFCQINDKAPVYIHKNAISKCYGTDEEGNIEKYNCGIRWSEDFIEELSKRAVFTENVVKLNDNMTIIGNIKPLDEFPMTEKFYKPAPGTIEFVDCDGVSNGIESRLVIDDMSHEQVLVVKEKDGIYVFSGCSHTGMMAIMKRVEEVFSGEKIIALMAGMHLYPLEKEKKQQVVDAICNLNVENVFPVHCTGIDAILMFKQQLGDGCVIASAGEVYEF